MRINYNVSAMISNNALQRNDDNLAASLERLSSGLKINHGKDNPAGLAMGKRMNAQLEGLSVATQNASNGISIIETADGALAEMQDILQRINELAVKANNGTLSADDRNIINDEVVQLKEELGRIKNTTEFNSMTLLNGEFEPRGYTSDKNIKVSGYSQGMNTAEKYIIDSIKVTEWGEEERSRVKEVVNPDNSVSKEYETYKRDYPKSVEVHSSDPKLDNCTATIKDSIVTIRTQEGYTIDLDLQDLEKPADPANFYEKPEPPSTNIEVDLTGIGAMRLQIGANEGQVLEIPIPDVSLKHMGIENIDVLSKDDAADALSRISGAISYISQVRSELGAYQNRLENSVDSLDITYENMTSSYSRIMDVDMAQEMSEYTKNQILTQAGTSMLAQANERPSQILQLLQ